MAEMSRRWLPRATEPAPEKGPADLAEVRARRAVVVGDATPLGLVAFATSVFVVGSVLAGWWPRPALQLLVVVPILIVFGGIAQFIAAMWSYGRGHTLNATFLGAFGSFFAALGVYELVTAQAVRSGTTALGGAAITTLGPLGVVVGCFAFIALFVAIGAMFTNLGLSLTSIALTVSLICLSWAFFAQGNLILEAIAGWAAVVSGALGFLTAALLTVGGGVARFATLGARPWRAI